MGQKVIHVLFRALASNDSRAPGRRCRLTSVAFRRQSRDAKIRLLSGVALFSACKKHELGRVAALTDEVQAPKGRTLVKEGDRGREFFVVVEGEAIARRGGRKVATIGPGSFFGELALLDQGPRAATVTAETDMRLLVLTSRDFSSLLQDVPSVSHGILRGVAERLRASESAPTH
jgi:CRP/FNR family cyclic AMP-dependent transcriptional regulator